MIHLTTPLKDTDIESLHVGDVVSISGYIYTGRDAVLPKIVKLIENDKLDEYGIDLKGAIIFHTAVSSAGVGPTSSNKLEIESSFPPLSKAGVKIHLGKGALSSTTIESLNDNCSAFAIIPPVTALLESLTSEREVMAFPELGMEALHRLKVENYQAVIAAVHGKSIY